MSHRVLSVILSCITTWGIGSAVIASGYSGFEKETLLAQDSDSTPQSTNSTEDTPDQREGSPTVQDLQRRLAELGYYSGAIDGLYGPATRDALAEFQTASGLASTGILDPLTRKGLSNPEAPRAASTSENSSIPDSTPLESNISINKAQTNQTSALEAESSQNPADNSVSNGSEGFTLFSEKNIDGEAVGLGGEEAQTAQAAPSEDSEAADSLPSEPASSDDPQNDRGLFRLAIVGLVIVILGGLGGAVVLLTRRGSATSAMTEEEEPEGPPDTVEVVSKHEEPISTPLNSGLQNGSVQPSSPSQISEITTVNHQTLSPKSASSPRLAKVNIVDELIQDLDAPDPGTRRKAIWELGQRGNSSAVQPLINAMTSADSREQSLILAALAEIGIRTLKPMNRALALSLQDENPEVRKNAIRDLTRVYDSMGQVGRILGHAANDDDPEVRRTARWALDQLNHVRLSAVESAGLLPEGTPSMDNLPENFLGEKLPENNFPEDETSSRKR